MTYEAYTEAFQNLTSLNPNDLAGGIVGGGIVGGVVGLACGPDSVGVRVTMGSVATGVEVLVAVGVFEIVGVLVAV